MVHQSCSYLKLKGSTYYFSRRVPKPLQKHFKTDRVEVCLHTPQQSSAVRQAQVLASELEDHWYILRRREIKHRLSSVFGDGSDDMRQTASVTGVGPQLSAALEVYLSLKGAGRPKTFEAGARRAVGYLLEVTDDKPIDAYVRADANAFREYLRSRGLSSESIGRNLTSIRAIVNFVSKEEGLQPPLAFSGVYLGEPTRKTDRYVPTATELRLLQARCRSSNDELRWLLALISDTGLRLSEALGLSRIGFTGPIGRHYANCYPMLIITAPAAIIAINTVRFGPTDSLRNRTPIMAANKTDVSRSAAAMPTLSRRVAIMKQPKLSGAKMLPARPFKTRGRIVGIVSFPCLIQKNTTIGIVIESMAKNQNTKVSGSGICLIP